MHVVTSPTLNSLHIACYITLTRTGTLLYIWLMIILGISEHMHM